MKISGGDLYVDQGSKVRANSGGTENWTIGWGYEGVEIDGLEIRTYDWMIKITYDGVYFLHQEDSVWVQKHVIPASE